MPTDDLRRLIALADAAGKAMQEAGGSRRAWFEAAAWGHAVSFRILLAKGRTSSFYKRLCNQACAAAKAALK